MAKKNVHHVSKLENLKNGLAHYVLNILIMSKNPYELIRILRTERDEKKNVLHVSKLENLKKWLVQDGWSVLPNSNNPYEVLRAVKDGKQTPLIIHSGKSVEYLSFADRDIPVIEAFLRSENRNAVNELQSGK